MNASPFDPYLEQRRRMVDEQIRGRGIADERVLAVLEQVPRELFIPPEDRASAFSDQAVAIAGGQSISQPYMVAAMTADLRLESGHRVLEIGTGSGYQTAVLARLTAQVYTIERLEPLLTAARTLLESLSIHNVAYRLGDGSIGWPEQAPFDRIIVTAAAPHFPPALIQQLTDGGRLVIPVGGAHEQTLTIMERCGLNTREIPRFACRFVKLIGRQAWPQD